ncbi:MAG TPA: hypothetical protein VFO95_02510, partial [Gemmatimonadales bacterium]|nr:hypothetical protein [Gemmatimonadales bacterium]
MSAGIVIGLVGLLVLAILLLQLDGVATRVLPMAGRFLPWDDATLEADHVSVSGLSRIEATSVRIASGGRTLFSIDSLDLSIRPIGLLAGRIDLPALRVVGVRAVARERADSTWNLLEPFTVSPDTAPGAPMAVRIGVAHIEDVSIIGYYAATPDSLLIDDLIVTLRDVRTGEVLGFTLDTLNARVLAPGRARPATLSGRARLSERQLTVPGFRLRSDSSDVVARGTLILPGPGPATREIRDVDFRLVAEPLDFRDVQPLAPTLELPASMRLTARVTGRSTLLRVDLDGRTSDGAILELDGELTPATTGPVRYRLKGAVRNLDPRMLGMTGARGRTSAEVDLALAGDSLPV